MDETALQIVAAGRISVHLSAFWSRSLTGVRAAWDRFSSRLPGVPLNLASTMALQVCFGPSIEPLNEVFLLDANRPVIAV